MKKILLLLLAASLAGILSACRNSASTELSGEDKEAVLAFSEAKTDNLMEGLTSGDYKVFSKDFDKPMLYAMQEPIFESFKQDRDAKLGTYVSRTVKKVAKGSDGHYTVIYNAVFDHDEDVIMRVVFRQQEPHEISGLWFNR